MKSFYRLSCSCSSQAVKELAVSLAIDLGMQGCEEYAKGAKTQLEIYFPGKEQALEAERLFRGMLPDSSPSLIQVPPTDWNREWKRHLKPVNLAENIWVAPPWLAPGKNHDHWIRIEPKMAFGTGHHESTRLAAQGMVHLRDRILGNRFVDVGAGSGVLSFLAQRLGAELSMGIEIDLECLPNLVENIGLNPVLSKGTFVMGTIAALKPAAVFDVMAINMIRTKSMPLVEECGAIMKPGGYGIWSGLLIEECAAARRHAANTGWRMVKELRMNDWWCGIMDRK